jgi:hypothetical protein
MYDVFHADVLHIDLFHYSTTSPDRFETKADVRALEGAIVYKDIPGSPGHFAADDKTSVSAVDDVIADDDVLRRSSSFAAFFVSAGFDADAVISCVEGAVLQEYILTGFNVDAVPIGGIPGITNVYIMHREILA